MFPVSCCVRLSAIDEKIFGADLSPKGRTACVDEYCAVPFHASHVLECSCMQVYLALRIGQKILELDKFLGSEKYTLGRLM